MSHQQHAEAYVELCKSIDTLFVLDKLNELSDILEKEIEERYNNIAIELCASDLLEQDEEAAILRHLESVILLRNQALRLSLVSGPIVSQVYPDSDSDTLARKRDLVQKIAKDSSESSEISETLRITMENRQLLQDVLQKLKSLNRILELQNQINSKVSEETQEISDLSEQLKRAKVRSSVLSEFLTALVTSTGLNWSNNQFIQETLEYCGKEYLSDSEQESDDDD